MSKKPTKAQLELRERNEKAALYQRVMDIASGAGLDVDTMDGDEFFCADFEAIPRFMVALEETFLDIHKEEQGTWDNSHLFSVRAIPQYDTPAHAVDYLYKGGVRA